MIRAELPNRIGGPNRRPSFSLDTKRRFGFAIPTPPPLSAILPYKDDIDGWNFSELEVRSIKGSQTQSQTP